MMSCAPSRTQGKGDIQLCTPNTVRKEEIIIIASPFKVHPILKEELQLVGITALLIASKYEEVCALQVDDLIYVTDNSYTASNVHAMESLMLKTLGYFLGTPTALCFLRWYSRVAQVRATIM